MKIFPKTFHSAALFRLVSINTALKKILVLCLSWLTVGCIEEDSVMISVDIQGSGKGQVTSSPSGINCDADCSATFTKDSSQINLTASADKNSIFVGWKGDCQGKSCSLNGKDDYNVTAVFDNPSIPDIKLTVTLKGSGQGTVTSSPAGIDCSETCETDYAQNSGIIKLLATPENNSTFVRWEEDCQGKTCSVDRQTDHHVSAVFDQAEENWTLSTSRLDFVGVTNSGALKAKSFKLNNSGNTGVDYSVTGVPDWLTASPDKGTAAAGGAADIQLQPENCNSRGRDEAIVQVSTDNHSETISVTRVCSNKANIDFALDRFYINQGVPAMDTNANKNRQVPLVINRKGLARAFVSASQPTELVPDVVLNYRTPDGKTGRVDFPSKARLSTRVRESNLEDTFNIELQKEFMVKGLEYYIEVDPHNSIAEIDESNNRLPASGYFSGTMVLGEKFEVTFVPVTLAGIPHRDTSMQKMRKIMDHVWSKHPLSEIDIQMHAPISVSAGAGNQIWNKMLEAVGDLYYAEGSSRFYVGIVDGDNRALRRSSTAGIAPMGNFYSMNSASGWVVAHELGHNMSLPHAPCGGVGGPDHSYPYKEGEIGVWGYDFIEKKLKAPDKNYDQMGYCSPRWTSDYNYKKIIEFREWMNSSLRKMTEKAPQNVLIIRGSIESGNLSIDKVFSLNTLVQETEEGDYLLRGLDKTGSELFTQSFKSYELSETSVSHFGISIVVDEQVIENLDSLEVSLKGKLLHKRKANNNSNATNNKVAKKATQARIISLTDTRVEVVWNNQAYEAIIVRDPINNQVLGSDKSGRLIVQPESHIVEVIYSNGLQSHSEMITVQTATVE